MTREEADNVGRLARQAGARGATFVSACTRYVAGVLRWVVRSIEAIPAAVRVFAFVGLLMLLGIVGAITQHNTVGLACIVVIIPVCSMLVGVLGQRWYRGSGAPQAQTAAGPAGEASPSDLQRALVYVDKKLTAAFNAFGADRQQHAMVALFQAKTAVELTLGTEEDSDPPVAACLDADDHTTSARVRAGSASTPSLHESNSLAAS